MGDFPHTVVRSLSSAWNATLGYLQSLWLATASSNVDLHVPAKSEVSDDCWWRAYLPLMPEGIRTALGDDKAAVIVPVIVTVLLSVVGVCVCACLCCCVRRCCSRRRRLNEKEDKDGDSGDGGGDNGDGSPLPKPASSEEKYEELEMKNTTPPQVTSRESLTDVKPGGKVVFTVTATGTEPLSYQGGRRIDKAGTSTLSITAVQKSDEGSYTVPGSDVQFTVTATGTAPLSYQWQKDEVNLTNGDRIKGASTSTLSITTAQKSDEGRYRSVVSNTAGKVTSKPATLALATPPQVTSHPESLTDVKPGSKVVFTVTATGTEPLSYQWQKDGVNLTDGGSIRGTTTAKLSITAVQKGDEGGYTCVVSNTAGTVASKPATLSLVTQAEVLTGKTWYPGNISEKEAVSRLMEDGDRSNGSYVVYDHPDRENSFVLLVWWKGHVHKLSINEVRSTDDEGREKMEYVLGEDVNQKKHSTVKALIKYHRGVTGVAIQLEDGTRITLTKSRVEPLEQKRWYHGNISHEEAESRLRRGCGGKDGTYLVYDSPSGRKGSYKLPVYYQGEIIKELEINRVKHEGEKFVYVLGEGGPGAIIHSSVKELVKYHRGLTGVPIQLKDGRKFKLTEHVYLK